MNMPNLASWNQRRAARFSMAGWYGADFPGRAKAAAVAKRSICLLVMAVTSDLNAKRVPAAGCRAVSYTDAHKWREIQRLWRTLQRAAAGFSLRRAGTGSGSSPQHAEGCATWDVTSLYLYADVYLPSRQQIKQFTGVDYLGSLVVLFEMFQVTGNEECCLGSVG